MNRTWLVAKVGEDRGQVALDLQRRAGCLLEGDSQFVGDDVGQRRLAKARRTVEQHMVERFAARFGGLDGDVEIVFDLCLADEFLQALRAEFEFE